MLGSESRRREAPGPLKSLVAVTSAVSFLILSLLAILQLNAFSRSTKSADDALLESSRVLSMPRASADREKYLIGVGKADITGPIVEINFAGYASLGQVGTGLRQRIYSKAFIIGEVDHPENRFIYLILDIQGGDTAVRYGILDGLAALGSNYSMYGQSNLAVTGTHSHSGPGAWFNYLLPQITSLGFDQQSYQAIVDGALLSIKRAHESLTQVCDPKQYI